MAGDGTRLPFADDAFDAVTISFGLRNVVDHRRRPARDAAGDAAGRAAGGVRVLAPDLRAVPHRLHRVPDARAAADRPHGVSSNPDAYVYLAESIRAWPDQAALAEQLREAGWTEVEWRNLTGGIVALHRATAP